MSISEFDSISLECIILVALVLFGELSYLFYTTLLINLLCVHSTKQTILNIIMPKTCATTSSADNSSMTLSSIMHFLKNMKLELQQDPPAMKSDMIAFQTEVSSKIDHVLLTMDTTCESAHSDWTAAIAAFTFPLELCLSETVTTLTATVDTITTFAAKLDITTTNVASLETNVTSLHEKVEAIQPPLSPSKIRQILNDKWESDLDGPMTVLYNLKDTVDTCLAELDSLCPTPVS
jgi:hypothetical protein